MTRHGLPSFLIGLLLFLSTVNAQISQNDNSQINGIGKHTGPTYDPEDDTCPGPEPEPYPPPHPFSKPTPTTCAPCTPIIATSTTTEFTTITDSSNVTATTTKPPQTVTVTTTETSTVTTTASIQCQDPPIAPYKLGSCYHTAPKIVHEGIWYNSTWGNGDYHYTDLPALMDVICKRLDRFCDAPVSTMQRCRAAEAAANNFSDDDSVSVWNVIMAPCVPEESGSGSTARKLRRRGSWNRRIRRSDPRLITRLDHE